MTKIENMSDEFDVLHRVRENEKQLIEVSLKILSIEKKLSDMEVARMRIFWIIVSALISTLITLAVTYLIGGNSL